MKYQHSHVAKRECLTLRGTQFSVHQMAATARWREVADE